MNSAQHGRAYYLDMIVPNSAYAQFILQTKNYTTQSTLTNMSRSSTSPCYAYQDQVGFPSWMIFLALLLHGLLIAGTLWLAEYVFRLLQDRIQSLKTWSLDLNNSVNELRRSQPLSARGRRGVEREEALGAQNERLDFFSERNAIIMDMLRKEFREAMEELECSYELSTVADRLEEEYEREDGQESELDESVESDRTVEDETPKLSREPRELDGEESETKKISVKQASEDGDSDGESSVEDAREGSRKRVRMFAGADGHLTRVCLPRLIGRLEKEGF